MSRVIFHIDMNSYFASVASQMNPQLRGKAIGVGGKPGTRGIIAAASREAKARGVKTAMSAYAALRACPELLIVDGDMRAVTDLTNRFLAIFRRYTDEVEVFSIDEAFLDVTDWHERFGGPVELARRIKDDIRRELGECITCSIGIAENKLLAKLASDLKKPDGLVVLDREGFAGRHVGAYVRYGDFWSGAGDGVTTNSYTDDGLAVFRLAWQLLRRPLAVRPVRALGITVSDLSRAGQLPLFDRDRRRAALLAAADDVNDRYGERTVEPLATAGAVLKRHVSGFKTASLPQ